MGICAHRIATPLLLGRAIAPQRVRAEPGRQTHVCAIHSRKAACLLKVLPTVTGKLFLIFLPGTRGPCTRGSPDFARPAHPIATPLLFGQSAVEAKPRPTVKPTVNAWSH